MLRSAWSSESVRPTHLDDGPLLAIAPVLRRAYQTYQHRPAFQPRDPRIEMAAGTPRRMLLVQLIARDDDGRFEPRCQVSTNPRSHMSLLLEGQCVVRQIPICRPTFIACAARIR